MPLLDSPGLCGPKVIARILGVSVQEAQTLCGWKEGKGAEPENLVKGLRSSGYRAQWREFLSVEDLVRYIAEHDVPVIIVDYFDELNGGTEGHYAIFMGLDEYGDIKLWNPDNPECKWIILPRAVFELRWYDYRIFDPSIILRRGAIMAHKKDA